MSVRKYHITAKITDELIKKGKYQHLQLKIAPGKCLISSCLREVSYSSGILDP